MNAHQLDANGVIINTIVVNSLDVLPNLVAADIGGQIGDSVVNGTVVSNRVADAVRQVPEFVDRRQGRQALVLGGYFGKVQGIIDQIVDPTERALTQVWWEDAPLFERNHHIVEMFAAGLDIGDDDLDALFIFAKTL